MSKKQTFIQTISATAYEPVTREMVADALERIAIDLRKPACPDPDDRWHLTWNQRLEIQGNCWLGNTPETAHIQLTIDAP